MKQAQPQHILRRILALQTAITMKVGTMSSGGEGKMDRTGRALLSANYVPNGRTVVNAAGSLGRGFLTAGDRLRDLIVPESLAAIMGGWSGRGGEISRKDRDGRSEEKLKEELDAMLAASCPLCDDVVLGVDKPFVTDEKQGDWAV
jgi:vacuolar protein sorting-associated protein 18